MGALNIDLILYLLEKQVDQIEFRILDDYLKSQPTAEKPKELSELVNAILQKRNNQPDTTDKLRQFFRKIETKYPGSLFSCWENMVRLVVGRTLSSVSR